MTADDIICGLEALHAIVRDPVTGAYGLRLDYAAFQMHIDKWEAKAYVKLNPKALVWTPFIMGRVEAQIPAVSTVAPREDAETEVSEEAEDPNPIQAESNDPMQTGTSQTQGNGKGKGKGIDATGKVEATDDGDADLDMKMEDTQTSLGDILAKTDPKPKTLTAEGMDISTEAPPASGKSPYLIKLGHELDSPTPSHSSPLYKNVPFDEESCYDDDAFDIPPTRFEVYPPLPGSYPKRGGRGGGGFGSTVKVGRKRTMSPAVSTPVRTSSSVRGKAVSRGRTRSHLTDTVKVVGDNMGRRSTSARGGDSAPNTPTPAPSMEDVQFTVPDSPPPPPQQPKFLGFNSQDSGVGNMTSSSGEANHANPPSSQPPSLRGKAPRASFVVSSEV